MNLLFNNWSELTSSFVEALIYIIIFTTFSNKKDFIAKSKLRVIIFSVLYALFSFWATTYMPFGLHTYLILVFTVLILTFIMQTNIFSAAIIIIITAVFLIVTELLILTIEISITGNDLATIISNDRLRLIHVIIGKSFQILIISLLYIIRKRISIFKLSIFEKEHALLSMYLIHLFMLSAFIFTLNYSVTHNKNTGTYNILVFAIYFIFIILSFIDFKNRQKMLKNQHKMEVQEDYINNIEAVLSVIRREKHDFLNHINTIFALSVLNKPDSLKRIEAYVRKLSDNLSCASYRFYNTGIDYVDGLLAIKSVFAIDHFIDLKVSVDVPLSAAKIDESELTIILGNIIDNAFEAALTKNNNSNDSMVSFSTAIENNNLTIYIKDNGIGIPDDIREKIFNEGYSTKKDKRDHGFGLYITQQHIKKAGGEIHAGSRNGITEFKIKLPLRKDKDEKVGTVNYSGSCEIKPGI